MNTRVAIEPISVIEIATTGELLLLLESKGNPQYQYIYREAVGVYWDAECGGFKSMEPLDWTYPEWFRHIRAAVLDALGVQLVLTPQTQWANVPAEVEARILDEAAQ